MAILELLTNFYSMIEEEEDQTEVQPEEELGAKPFTDTDLIRVLSVLFVFAVYFYIFLKIMFLS